MPCNSCSSSSYGPSSNEEIIKKDKLMYYQHAEAIACAFIRHYGTNKIDDLLDEESGITVEQFDLWWNHHEEIDKKRRMLEEAQEQQKRIKKARRIKALQDELKELTGIDPAINFDSKS